MLKVGRYYKLVRGKEGTWDLDGKYYIKIRKRNKEVAGNFYWYTVDIVNEYRNKYTYIPNHQWGMYSKWANKHTIEISEKKYELEKRLALI